MGSTGDVPAAGQARHPREESGHGDRLSGNGVSPFAINEKFDVGIGVHWGYLHDADDTADAVRPGDVNKIFLAGRYPASRLSLRGICVWIFPTGLVELPETTAFILRSGRRVSTVHTGNRHDFSAVENLSSLFPRRADGAPRIPLPQTNQMRCAVRERFSTQFGLCPTG